jgi:molybdopterin-guanine dinucleotide biosynthesis protein A
VTTGLPTITNTRGSRQPLTGIVLVGGRSTRLQTQSKPLVVVGNKLILARIVDALRPVCDELIAVVRPDQDDPTADTALALRMHVVQDAEPGAGPLAAICAGFQAAATPLSLVVGGDHPFLSRELMSAMADAAARHGAAIVPTLAGRYQPLHAVYPTAEWRRAFRDALERGERSPTRVLKAAVAAGTPDVQAWDQDAIEPHDPGLMSLIDVDTPTQLARARSLADWRVNVRPGLRPPGGA